jgi:pilus assembly protein CpaB
MNRRGRTVAVVSIALITAALASFGVYRAIERIPVREVPIAEVYAVVAASALPVGTELTRSDVKLVPWPASDRVPGGFTDPDAVVGRGLLVQVLENEPLAESKLAPLGAGAGLPPTIRPGMRAISVQVNDVIGVAGFVVPGTRVDVVVTTRQTHDSMARVVVSNVEVLAAGTKYDQQLAKKGEPIRSTVVTLLVTPPDAERIALATSEGSIVLALRNPLDLQPTESIGVRMASLMAPPDPPRPPTPRPVPPAVAKPAAPKTYTVETIRAGKSSEEVVEQ